MSVRANYDTTGDPASGSREVDKFYAADAKDHADLLNTLAVLSGSASAYVSNNQSTSSTTYTDLGNTDDYVTVTVGTAALVVVSAIIRYGSGTGVYPYVGFAVSGANTQSAVDNRSAMIVAADAGLDMSVSMVQLLTGLTPGSTTFKMKYRVSGGSWSFAHRRIGVLPLP